MRNLNGLVDAHVHLNESAGLEVVRSAGIIAVRDAGLRRNADTPRVEQHKPRVPVVVASRWALYKKGGYGARFGVSATTGSELRTELMRLKHAGADIIKVMASGIVSLTNPGMVTPGGFDPAELLFIVEEAKELGLSVMAHANSEPAIMAAAGSGVRSIEHGFFMTDAAVDLMAANGVFWVPTIGALVRAAEKAKKARLFMRDLVNAQLQKLKRAHALGVPLAIGTDCVLPDAHYRQAYEAELAYFEGAGIARRDVLKIAVEGGARLLGTSLEKQPLADSC